STLKSPSYTKSVSWQHYRTFLRLSISTTISLNFLSVSG
ncbi:IS1 encoded protein, partial [Shigella flexneri]